MAGGDPTWLVEVSLTGTADGEDDADTDETRARSMYWDLVESVPVAIAVIDTGVGIPQKDHHRVFERFYRVDRGRSSASGGTGLGLAIVRHVAVNHGGRVEVISQEGIGSTFTMILPGESAEEAGSEKVEGEGEVAHE